MIMVSGSGEGFMVLCRSMSISCSVQDLMFGRASRERSFEESRFVFG